MEKIQVNATLLVELKSKQEWVNRVPAILPDKIRAGEIWIWVDKNGSVFECGRDFMTAEKFDSYPCKVYRVVCVDEYFKSIQPPEKDGK